MDFKKQTISNKSNNIEAVIICKINIWANIEKFCEKGRKKKNFEIYDTMKSLFIYKTLFTFPLIPFLKQTHR